MVLGRWIDADDHMYIENLAVGEEQCPPFRLCFFFGGGVPLFVIHPFFLCSSQWFEPRPLSFSIYFMGFSLASFFSVEPRLQSSFFFFFLLYVF